MKLSKKILIFTFLLSLFPAMTMANIGIETSTEVRISSPSENKLDLRRLDLQKRLFKEEVNDKKNELQKAKEAFQNATSDTRNIMRSEFQAKFIERFKFTTNKLNELQAKTQIKVQTESNNGVGTEVSELKLEESVNLSSQAEIDIQSLVSLLSERYSEEERDEKKEEARLLVEKIKVEIKSSHKALKDVFQEIKKAKSQSAEIDVQAEINIENN